MSKPEHLVFHKALPYFSQSPPSQLMITLSFQLLNPKTVDYSFVALFHTPYELCQQMLLVLPLKYVQKLAISYLIQATIISHLCYLNNLLSVQSFLAPLYLHLKHTNSQSDPAKR